GRPPRHEQPGAARAVRRSARGRIRRRLLHLPDHRRLRELGGDVVQRVLVDEPGRLNRPWRHHRSRQGSDLGHPERLGPRDRARRFDLLPLLLRRSTDRRRDQRLTHGTFKDALGHPLITTRQFGPQSIDPYPFIDDDGTRYLYFGSGTGGLRLVKLGADMTSLAGTPVDISPAGASGVLEGSALFKRKGTYYLQWSEGDTRNAT